jgi:hypothetical protein
MVTRTRTVVVVNKCQCARCLDIIESKSRHAFVQCSCGAIFTDGGTEYIRRGGEIENIIDMSETYEETFESEW